MQWCLLACNHGLLSLLIETETTSLAVAPPTVDCPSYINHHFHRPVWWEQFLSRESLFPAMPRVSARLTDNQGTSLHILSSFSKPCLVTAADPQSSVGLCVFPGSVHCLDSAFFPPPDTTLHAALKSFLHVVPQRQIRPSLHGDFTINSLITIPRGTLVIKI